VSTSTVKVPKKLYYHRTKGKSRENHRIKGESSNHSLSRTTSGLLFHNYPENYIRLHIKIVSLNIKFFFLLLLKGASNFRNLATSSVSITVSSALSRLGNLSMAFVITGELNEAQMRPKLTIKSEI